MKNYFLFIIIFLGFNVNAQLAGTLNTAFSQDGWDDTFFGGNPGLAFPITKTIIQPDGKILICAGANYLGEPKQAVITRYNPDGTVDMNFGGGDGVVRSKQDSSIDIFTNALGMALQSNGKIIIAGNSFGKAVVFRLNADGSLDTSFATNGVFEIVGGDLELIFHVGVQTDNKIIVCGREIRIINGVAVKHIFLWRFTENGIIDTTFGDAGDVSYTNADWVSIPEITVQLNDLIILPDNKIIINQSYPAISSKVLLRKLNANGTLDTSFGTNGEAIKSEVNDDDERRYSSSSLQPDGSIVSSFTSRNAENINTETLFRVNNQGVLDATFNVNLGNPTLFPEIVQVIASDDKIYVFKKAIGNFAHFDEIRCFDLNGNSVTSFGTNGTAIINQNNIPISESAKAVISPNGNIYIASSVPNSDLGQMFFVSNVIGFNPNLSTANKSTENKTIVFPNPSSGIISISNTKNETIDKIEINDISGKLIAVKSQNTTQIDISEFTNGIYILKLYCGNAFYLKKVIKN